MHGCLLVGWSVLLSINHSQQGVIIPLNLVLIYGNRFIFARKNFRFSFNKSNKIFKKNHNFKNKKIKKTKFHEAATKYRIETQIHNPWVMFVSVFQIFINFKGIAV